jgi:hypothetical protein
MKKNKHFLFVSFAALFLFGGCATTILSNDRIIDETAGALKLLPDDITIENRRTEIINTYYSVKTTDGKEYNCIINGGNILTLGILNSPRCTIIKEGQKNFRQ